MKLDLTVIEDTVYGFLDEETPLGGARTQQLHRARQPVEEGYSRTGARLHCSADAPARAHHGRGSIGRMDRLDLRSLLPANA